MSAAAPPAPGAEGPGFTSGPGSIRVAGDTNVGKVRSANEDAMIVDPGRGLYVVLDGMGGANAGDVASQTARDIFFAAA